MEEHRPEMTKLLMKALKRKIGDTNVAAAVKEAAAEYAELHCDGQDADLDTMYLAQSNMKRLSERGVTDDAARSGRPPVALDDDVEAALRIFLNGNGERGDKWWGFTSLRHALNYSAQLRALLEKMNIKAEALWLRMKAKHIELHGKEINQINIKRRPQLSKQCKKQRLQIAKLWQQWGYDKLCKVVWIDEKQEYLHHGGTYRCYAPPGVKSMQRETPIKLGKSEKIKYEAAVSAFGGACYFEFITGTTGLEKAFEVRTFIPLWRYLGPTLVVAQPPCLVQQLALDVHVLVGDAQHAEVLLCGGAADAQVRSDLLAVGLWLVRPMLLAVDEHEQPALVCGHVRHDGAFKDEHVDTHLCQVYATAQERLDFVHERAARTSDLPPVQVPDQGLLLL